MVTLVVRGSRRIGYEVKYTSRPVITKSMRAAMQDLKLAKLEVVHPGAGSFPLAENVRAVGLADLKP